LREFRIGTRESRLALWQARWVAAELNELCPGIKTTLVKIKTKGDNILDTALSKIGDKGLFTKELEAALIKGDIDMAVHSMKDLPAKLPPGLFIAAICKREYPGDVLISRKGLSLAQLPAGALIGTSSLRRIVQVRGFRPDLQAASVRGNLNTRMRKLDEGRFDALLLAYAGIVRLGYNNRITELVPLKIMLPAAGQGSVGVEAREDDAELLAVLSKLDDQPARKAVIAERSLLNRLEGGCQVPIGTLAWVDGEEIVLEAVVADLDGKKTVRRSMAGHSDDPAGLGARLAKKMIADGAGEILDKVRQEFDKDGIG